MKQWLVKVQRYSRDGTDGGESVIGSWDDKVMADAIALQWNTNYQTDTAWVEEFDRDKLQWS
jgi:hypothetical protein